MRIFAHKNNCILRYEYNFVRNDKGQSSCRDKADIWGEECGHLLSGWVHEAQLWMQHWLRAQLVQSSCITMDAAGLSHFLCLPYPLVARVEMKISPSFVFTFNLWLYLTMPSSFPARTPACTQRYPTLPNEILSWQAANQVAYRWLGQSANPAWKRLTYWWTI